MNKWKKDLTKVRFDSLVSIVEDLLMRGEGIHSFTDIEMYILHSVLIEGMTYQQIADNLGGINPERVGAIFKKCVTRLKSKIFVMTGNQHAIGRMHAEISSLEAELKEYKSIMNREGINLPELTEEAKKLFYEPLPLNQISTRTRGFLSILEIKTYGQLIQVDVEQMKKWRNFGKGCLMELENLLHNKGLEFGMQMFKNSQ